MSERMKWDVSRSGKKILIRLQTEETASLLLPALVAWLGKAEFPPPSSRLFSKPGPIDSLDVDGSNRKDGYGKTAGRR